jgi:hypothetical protein
MKGNRSASATFGAAFFFLSLAAVPVSMKAVGLEVRLAPTMSAVVDAWGEIAGAFAAGNQPISATGLSAVNNSSPFEGVAPEAGAEEKPCAMACANEEEWVEADSVEPVASAAEAVMSEPARSIGAKSIRRAPAYSAPAYRHPVMQAAVRVAPEPPIDFNFIEVAQAMPNITLDGERLMRGFQMRTEQYRFEMREALKLASMAGGAKVYFKVTTAKPAPQIRAIPICSPESNRVRRPVRTRLAGPPATEAEESTEI